MFLLLLLALALPARAGMTFSCTTYVHNQTETDVAAQVAVLDAATASSNMRCWFDSEKELESGSDAWMLANHGVGEVCDSNGAFIAPLPSDPVAPQDLEHCSADGEFVSHLSGDRVGPNGGTIFVRAWTDVTQEVWYTGGNYVRNTYHAVNNLAKDVTVYPSHPVLRYSTPCGASFTDVPLQTDAATGLFPSQADQPLCGSKVAGDLKVESYEVLGQHMWWYRFDSSTFAAHKHVRYGGLDITLSFTPAPTLTKPSNLAYTFMQGTTSVNTDLLDRYVDASVTTDGGTGVVTFRGRLLIKLDDTTSRRVTLKACLVVSEGSSQRFATMTGAPCVHWGASVFGGGTNAMVEVLPESVAFGAPTQAPTTAPTMMPTLAPTFAPTQGLPGLRRRLLEAEESSYYFEGCTETAGVIDNVLTSHPTTAPTTA